MIPDFITLHGSPWPVLPPGIYTSTIAEVYKTFATNPHRVVLFDGFKRGVDNLFTAGCPYIYLDGSFVTAKPMPNDYEICWEMEYVEPELLDPVFFDFDNGRHNQKIKYGGEYFPATFIEGMSGKPFVDFFQLDKYTGKQKGIVKLSNHLT